MKRKTLCVFVVLIGVSLVFFLNGCKKELQKQQNNSTVSSDLSHKVLTLVDNFLKKKSSNLKEGEVMSVDSTIWYLETAMNATYARMDSSVKIFKQDSAFISVPLNQDGSVNISDVYTAYNQLVDSLSVFYYSIEGTKSVLVNNVFAAGVTISQLQIGVNIILAQMPDPNREIEFGTTDNWYWGLLIGKCDYTFPGRDATTELTTHANYSIPIAPSGQSYFYIEVENTAWIYPDQNHLPSGQQNPYGFDDYYLFKDGSDIFPEYDECLSYHAMNYYLQNLFDLGVIYKPQGKEVIHYNCDFDLTGGIGYWLHVHKVRFTFGRRIIAYYDPETIPPNAK
ncbi:MAG: hypothetical protein WCI48_08185 [Bacteroidota bacterium]